MILHATANPKLAAAMEVSMEGKCNKREVWGKHISIFLGVLDVEYEVKT